MINNRGFTTIELIITMVIAGVIMGAVGTFLTFNIRGFNVAKDIIDVQYEGQLVINQFTDIAKESTGIIRIDLGGTDITSDNTYRNTELTPELIFFEHYRIESSNEVYYRYELLYDVSNPDEKHLDCLIYRDDGSGEVLYDDYIFAQYLDSFTVESVGYTFADAKTITIKMGFAEGRATHNLQTEVKFRNKH